MILFCSVPDEVSAQKISRVLVTEGLCACVSQIPKVKSYYIYEGKFCEDDEILLMIKSAPTHFDALERRIKELHPYDLPEIIATAISQASAEYKAWLLKALSADF